ncbi:MAG: MFS transporter [Phycisphaerae bacterium]
MTAPTSDDQRIRHGRKYLAAMSLSYALGAFNDNFFKMAAILIAANHAFHDFRGMASAVFSIPFVVFAAIAGWAADRYSKRNVIIVMKLLELVAMIIGVVAIFTQAYWLMLVVIFLMALQSTFFSPAVNGSIPEIFPSHYVPKANGAVKSLLVTCVLLGTVLSGYLLNPKQPVWGYPLGWWLVSGAVLVVSGVGALWSLKVAHRPAADEQARMPWSGPIKSFRILWDSRRDRMLTTAILADVFIWFIGTLQLLLIVALVKSELQMSDAMASNMIFPQLIGVAIGGVLAGRYCPDRHWYVWLVPAVVIMTLLCLVITAVQWLPEAAHLPSWLVLFGLIGVTGGLFMIPTESFIQVRPDPRQKGAVWASANFACFIGIFFASLLDILLTGWVGAINMFGVLGMFTVPAGLYLRWKLPIRRDAKM